MTAQIATAQSAYGAFELKRVYQKNMLLGTLISCAIPLIIIGSLIVINMVVAEKVVIQEEKTTKVVSMDELPPPTIIPDIKKPKIKQPPIELPLIGGVPKPVEDDEVFEVKAPPTRIQKDSALHAEYDGSPDGDFNVSGDMQEVYGDLMPGPEEFIAYNREPQLVNPEDCMPEYPEFAKKAGVEGIVWVQVLVDKEGAVRDAIVSKESGVSAGFEDAALEAAMKRVYQPAMQNDNPVAVWVTVRYIFELH